MFLLFQGRIFSFHVSLRGSTFYQLRKNSGEKIIVDREWWHEAETSDDSLTQFSTQLEQTQLLQYLCIQLYGYVTCIYIYTHIHYIPWECWVLIWSGHKTTQFEWCPAKVRNQKSTSKAGGLSQTNSSIMNWRLNIILLHEKWHSFFNHHRGNVGFKAFSFVWKTSDGRWRHAGYPHPVARPRPPLRPFLWASFLA